MLELEHRAILQQYVAAKRDLLASDAEWVTRSRSRGKLGLSGCRHNVDKNSTVGMIEERWSACAGSHCFNATMVFIALEVNR
jgi:hypothetical protein